MTKAILVLDEMPVDCAGCPCFDIGDTIVGWCNIKQPHSIKDMYKKPSWCPLKEMPKYKSTWDVGGFDRGKAFGWNECLEEIEK